MKKILLTVGIVVIVALGYLGYTKLGNQRLGGSADVRVNKFGDLTSFSTSTGSYCDGCPVQVLAYDTDRRYALFQNNSDTDLWLFATTTELDVSGLNSARFATGAITFLDGVLLEAKKAGAEIATYTVGPENLIYGYFYASSTATGKTIIVNYK